MTTGISGIGQIRAAGIANLYFGGSLPKQQPASAQTKQYIPPAKQAVLEEDFGPLPQNLEDTVTLLTQVAADTQQYDLFKRLTAAGEVLNLASQKAPINQDQINRVKAVVVQAIDRELDKPEPFKDDKATLNLAAKLIDACNNGYNSALLDRRNKDRREVVSSLTKAQREALDTLLFKIKLPSAIPGRQKRLYGGPSIIASWDNTDASKRWRRLKE